VAAAEVTRDGQNRQAMAKVSMVRERERGKRGAAELTVWVDLTDPAGRLGFWSGLSGLG
jgi:hypothetical protein